MDIFYSWIVHVEDNDRRTIKHISPFCAASAANEINQLERNKLKVKILTLLVFCARDSAQPTSQVRLVGECSLSIIFYRFVR